MIKNQQIILADRNISYLEQNSIAKQLKDILNILD